MTLLLLLGCRPAAIAVPPPAATQLYDDTRVLEVEIALDAADWESLRHETRSLWDIFGGDCLAAPVASPFTWYTGDVTVDGVALGPVGVRKKGFLGSLEAARPSLKLDLDRVDEEGAFEGVRKLTLNNNREDPTGLRTCLAYATYAAAGVPAPRCALAHVTVNGEDLGVYANVEPVDEAFLSARGFSPEGALFEGTLSDLREGWSTTFDPETAAADTGSLDGAVAAVASGDLDAIGEVVDVDAYLDFWAAETVVGQWDGYDGNTNNFFLYADPVAARLRFLPWGADATFDDTPVAANSALAQAVLSAPGGEEAFRAHLTQLLDDVWDGETMVATVDRLADLAEPWQGPDFRADVRALRAVVRDQEAALRTRLDGDTWGGALREPPCFVARGSVDATFSTTWDTLDGGAWTTGTATMEMTWDDAVLAPTPAGSTAGAQGDTAVIAVFASLPDGGTVVPYAYLPVAGLTVGTHDFDFVDVFGVLSRGDETRSPTFAAYIGDGRLTFDEAASTPGAVVRGRMEGTLYDYGW